MKKILSIFLVILLFSFAFSAKYFYYSDPETNGTYLYNLDNFDIIEIQSDQILLSVKTDTSSEKVVISTVNELEMKKMEKVNEMINNGFIVKAPSTNEYFGDYSTRNLTAFTIKSIKKEVFINEILKFMNSTDSFLNINRLILNFAREIPVEAD